MRKSLMAAAFAALSALLFVGIASAGTTQGSNVTMGMGAHTSFDRTWNWTVSKSDSAHSSVTVTQGQAAQVTYTVTVGNGSPAYTDSNWLVQDGVTLRGGPFTLNGLGDLAATATQGADTTSGSFSVCSFNSLYDPPVSFPITVPSGPTLLCHYTVPLPNGSPGTVTASATFSDGSTRSTSTAFDFSPSGNLEAGQPVVSNASVDVVDSQAGLLGSLTAPVDTPASFQYSIPVDSSTCGSYDIPNTVSVVDHATGTTLATADDTVHVTVTCPVTTSGCTLTQGYWKTHASGRKSDPTWNQIQPSGADSPFFLSGQSWLQVLNTAPKGGNVYYILAHQYEAAVLNKLSGASSTSAVDAAMADAQAFFAAYTPAQAGALSSSLRDQLVADAGTLDDYNSGLAGPGHCG